MLPHSSHEVEVEEKYNTIMKRVLAFVDANRVQELGLYPYFRPISSEQDTEVYIKGARLLMFGSNSYLGLTSHPKVKEAAQKAIGKYGTGCAGSRFLNGTLDIHIQCEEKIAEFIGKEAVLLYSTGFQANQGVISTLVGRDEYVLLDKLDHASIIEGARLSFGQMFRFKHNDMNSLQRKLRMCELDKGKLIVVDGVFSMDGDIANLPMIVQLADEYNAMVMLDDAHAIGVIGHQGRGTASHFGLTERVELIMGTFSKSLASLGGFIASDRATINYLKHHSRALIFSASMPAANVASVMAALDIVQSEPERMHKLWDNTQRMSDGLKGMGFNLGKSVTPILPLHLGDDLLCFTMCKMLQDEGIFVNPVVSPAVDANHALLRISLMATHTFEQIDRALEKFRKVGKYLGVIM